MKAPVTFFLKPLLICLFTFPLWGIAQSNFHDLINLGGHAHSPTHIKDANGFSLSGFFMPDTLCDSFSNSRWRLPLVKTDNSFNITWAKVYVSYFENLTGNFNLVDMQGHGMTQASNGDYLICGQIIDNTTPITEIHSFAMRILPNGTPIWFFKYIKDGLYTSVVETSDGGFLLCGYRTYGFAGTRWSQSRITRINGGGGEMWTKGVQDDPDRQALYQDIIRYDDSTYALTGEINKKVAAGCAPESNDVLLSFVQENPITYAPTLTHFVLGQNINIIGERVCESGHALTRGPNGNIIVTGKVAYTTMAPCPILNRQFTLALDVQPMLGPGPLGITVLNSKEIHIRNVSIGKDIIAHANGTEIGISGNILTYPHDAFMLRIDYGLNLLDCHLFQYAQPAQANSVSIGATGNYVTVGNVPGSKGYDDFYLVERNPARAVPCHDQVIAPPILPIIMPFHGVGDYDKSLAESQFGILAKDLFPTDSLPCDSVSPCMTPIAMADTLTFCVPTPSPTIYPVTANDILGSANDTIRLIPPFPVHGTATVVDAKAGLVTYSPFDPFYVGTDCYFYEVCCDTFCDTAKVTIYTINWSPIIVWEGLIHHGPIVSFDPYNRMMISNTAGQDTMKITLPNAKGFRTKYTQLMSGTPNPGGSYSARYKGPIQNVLDSTFLTLDIIDTGFGNQYQFIANDSTGSMDITIYANNIKKGSLSGFGITDRGGLDPESMTLYLDGDSCTRLVVDWINPTVILGSAGSYVGDRVEFKLNRGLDALTEVESIYGGLGQVIVESEEVGHIVNRECRGDSIGHEMVFLRAKGSANHQYSGGITALMDNIGSSGSDGFSLDFNASEAFQIELDPALAFSWKVEEGEKIFEATDPSGTPFPVGSLFQLGNPNVQADILFTLMGGGLTPEKVQIFANGSRVAEAIFGGPLIGTYTGFSTGAGAKKLPDGRIAVSEKVSGMATGSLAPILLNGIGPPIMGDEIRVVMYDPTGSVDTYTGLEFAGKLGTPGIPISRIILEDIPPFLTLSVMLEGPFDGTAGLMSDGLKAAGLLPALQPFGVAPWSYAGTETLDPTFAARTGDSAPVDWVMVVFYDLHNPSIVLGNVPGVVSREGVLTDGKGEPLTLPCDLVGDTAYLSIHHTRHLDVSSASAFELIGDEIILDFSNPSTSTYGTSAQKNLSGTMVMYSGDNNGDNTTNSVDLFNCLGRNGTPTVYSDAEDQNMDGSINSADFLDFILPNNGKQAQLP